MHRGGTHYKKRCAYCHRGVTPITKNITVTDQAGQHLEPTYLKRANGLVKHGRARWVDVNTICLTCPPDMMKSEGIDMDDKTIAILKEQIEFLKADLNREDPISTRAQMQPEPEAIIRIVEAREKTKWKILQLMDKLASIEPQPVAPPEEQQFYRQLLEKIAADHASLDMAKETLDNMVDEDVKQEALQNAVSQYEATKREIATKLLEKLG